MHLSTRNQRRRQTQNVANGCIPIAVLAIMAGIFFRAAPVHAQDVKTYTRATFDQWLAKYKDTKPDFKVGDVLTAKDLERIRPFIYPGYLEQLNFPEFRMPIAATVRPHAAQGLSRLHGEVPGAGQAAARPHDGQLCLWAALSELGHKRGRA